SSAAPITHSFANANIPSSTYQVTLSAVNALGCQAFTTQPVVVFKPPVIFQPSSSNFCVPLGGPATVSFSPLAPYSTYTIDFAESPYSTLVTTGTSAHTYTSAGIFSVQIE